MGAPGGQVNDHGGPSSATSDPASRWIELFYDLIFVAALLIFSVAVGHVHPASGIIWLVLVFAALWWVWFTTTVCANRFHMVDLRPPALVAISDAGHRSHGHGGAGFCRWRFRLSGGGVRFPAPHRWLHVLPCRTTEGIIRPRIRDAIGGSQCRYGDLFLRRGTTPRIRAAHPFRGEPRSAGDRLDRDVAACGRFLGHRRGALARAHGRVHPHRLRRSVRGDRHFGKRRHHRHSQYRGAHIRVHPGVRAVYHLLRRHPGRWAESAAIRPVGIAAPGYPDRHRRDGGRRVQAHQSQDLPSPSRLRDPLADGYPDHRLPGLAGVGVCTRRRPAARWP